MIETNTNAGSTLRQIAFDKSIMSQPNNTLYAERVKKYQQDHTLNDDDFSFSEQQLIDYFKGENVNIKKYIIDSIKHSITHHKENKLKDFIDFEGKKTKEKNKGKNKGKTKGQNKGVRSTLFKIKGTPYLIIRENNEQNKGVRSSWTAPLKL